MCPVDPISTGRVILPDPNCQPSIIFDHFDQINGSPILNQYFDGTNYCRIIDGNSSRYIKNGSNPIIAPFVNSLGPAPLSYPKVNLTIINITTVSSDPLLINEDINNINSTVTNSYLASIFRLLNKIYPLHKKIINGIDALNVGINQLIVQDIFTKMSTVGIILERTYDNIIRLFSPGMEKEDLLEKFDKIYDNIVDASILDKIVTLRLNVKRRVVTNTLIEEKPADEQPTYRISIGSDILKDTTVSSVVDCLNYKINNPILKFVPPYEDTPNYEYIMYRENDNVLKISSPYILIYTERIDIVRVGTSPPSYHIIKKNFDINVTMVISSRTEIDKVYILLGVIFRKGTSRVNYSLDKIRSDSEYSTLIFTNYNTTTDVYVYEYKSSADARIVSINKNTPLIQKGTDYGANEDTYMLLYGNPQTMFDP